MANAAHPTEGTPSDGYLGVTLATWVYLLHEDGHPAASEPVRAACEAISRAGPGEDMDALGRRLVDAIRAELGEAPDFERVRDTLCSWYGEEHVRTDLGEAPEREARVRRVRQYRFRQRKPWIATLIDRFPDGRVGLHWVMVQDLGEHVTIMDPYPWDEVDEEYTIPLCDFMVKWELAGLQSLRYD